MKAKSYSLADLAQLQKALEQEAKERARIEQEQTAQRAQQSRMSNEFLNEVKGVTPIKAKARYIHPPKTTLPPEHVLKKRQQAAGETEQVKKQNSHKRTHNQASDQFDAQHLRDDEVGTYLRRGVPETLLKKLQKGGWDVSARLDLHGKTVEEARIATSAFLYQSVSNNARVVSIIHGQETDIRHAQDNVVTDAFVFMGIELLSIATNDDTSTVRTQESEPSFPKVSPESSLLLSKAEVALHFNTEIQPTFDSNPNTTQIEGTKLRSFKQNTVEDVVPINAIELSIKQDKEPENQVNIVRTDLEPRPEVLAENHSLLSHLPLLSDEPCQPQEEFIIEAAAPIRFDLKPSTSISTLAIQDFIQRRSILAEQPDTDISSESQKQDRLKSEVTAPHLALQDSHTENSETSATAVQPILPTQINLGQYQAKLRTLHQPNLDPKLYGLDLSGHTEIGQNIDFLIHSDRLDHWLDSPIYVAEQTHQHGGFIKYLALFGADSPTEAICLSQQFAQSCQHQVAAIREIGWDQLQGHMHDVFSIFQLYTQQAKLVWHIEDYHPFILADLLNSRKFIQFEESSADANTPILVLKERQKIRVIHGQKRVELSRTEIAYPCLVLDRQHGISWQLIQNTISTLPEPITVFQLFDSIQKQLGSEL